MLVAKEIDRIMVGEIPVLDNGVVLEPVAVESYSLWLNLTRIDSNFYCLKFSDIGYNITGSVQDNHIKGKTFKYSLARAYLSGSPVKVFNGVSSKLIIRFPMEYKLSTSLTNEDVLHIYIVIKIIDNKIILSHDKPEQEDLVNTISKSIFGEFIEGEE